MWRRSPPCVWTFSVPDTTKVLGQASSFFFFASASEKGFHLDQITAYIRQFDIIINALSSLTVAEVRDIFLYSLYNNPYETLKEALDSRLAATEQPRLRLLVGADKLGDRRLSQVLCPLQQLLGDKAAFIDVSCFFSGSQRPNVLIPHTVT